MFSPLLISRAEALVKVCRERRLVLATAESCTGGLLAALITEVSGSSEVLDRGLVTYSNAAKQELLGVPETIIAENGAVSPQTASAMAVGALRHSRADIAVAVTGIAGPTGGSTTKPVGLVHFGLAKRGSVVLLLERRYGDLGRRGIRLSALDDALGLIEDAVRSA